MNPIPADQEGKNSETGDRNESTECQSKPKSEVLQQEWENQEHRERWHDIPECVPRMIGNFGFRLIFYMKPDQREDRYHWQCSDQGSEFVTAFCKF